MPVFFVRDGHKFVDMVHALKPNPMTHEQEWWRIWDFFSFHPESAHMFTWLLDDVGAPQAGLTVCVATRSCSGALITSVARWFCL